MTDSIGQPPLGDYAYHYSLRKQDVGEVPKATSETCLTYFSWLMDPSSKRAEAWSHTSCFRTFLFHPLMLKEWYLSLGFCEPYVRPVFGPVRADIVLDVGAHTGYCTLIAAQAVGPEVLATTLLFGISLRLIFTTTVPNLPRGRYLGVQLGTHVQLEKHGIRVDF